MKTPKAGTDRETEASRKPSLAEAYYIAGDCRGQKQSVDKAPAATSFPDPAATIVLKKRAPP